MSGKAAALQRHNALLELNEKVQRLHGLVEQYATARHGNDELLPAIGRTFAKLKTIFLGAGFDNMSQICAAMEIASRRGHSRTMKVRILRDAVGSIRMQLDVEMRSLLAEMKADEEKEKEAKQREQQESGATEQRP